MSTDYEYHAVPDAPADHNMLNPFRRIIAAAYCLAIAFTCARVPWSGYEAAMKGRANPTYLGYAFVWSGPKPPGEFETWDSTGGTVDLASGIVSAPGNPAPAPVLAHVPKPKGYISPAAYRNPEINFGQVMLEIVALTALGFAGWVLFPANAKGSATQSPKT